MPVTVTEKFESHPPPPSVATRLWTSGRTSSALRHAGLRRLGLLGGVIRGLSRMPAAPCRNRGGFVEYRIPDPVQRAQASKHVAAGLPADSPGRPGPSAGPENLTHRPYAKPAVNPQLPPKGRC